MVGLVWKRGGVLELKLVLRSPCSVGKNYCFLDLDNPVYIYIYIKFTF